MIIKLAVERKNKNYFNNFTNNFFFFFLRKSRFYMIFQSHQRHEIWK